MAKTRNITKEDIFIKARMLSEGVCIQGLTEKVPPGLRDISVRETKGDLSDIEIPEKLDYNDVDEIMELAYKSTLQRTTNLAGFSTLILDDSGLLAPITPNKHSRLDLIIKGETVTVSDGGEVLITGRFPKRPKWLDAKLSNGLPIEAALPAASAGIINVVFSLSCMNYNTKRGCRYCNLFANPVSRKIIMLPKETLRQYSKYQAEAVQIATDHGWRGTIAISGGALPPCHRPEYLERMGIVLSMLREYVGEETLKELRLVYNHYPPEDFSDMYKWKEMGIDAVSIDIEVMDSAYFAAICPGKSAYKPHAWWKKAQEAAVDVFGPGRSTGCIVMGIEPMSTLLKGTDERLSKGIIPIPLVFVSAPGAAYWGFRPPTAEWIVKASEKIADAIQKHASKFLGPNALKRMGSRANKKDSKSTQSTHRTVVFDELQRRLQMLGELMKPRKKRKN
ncbi:MAG: hypothetical protein HWN69_09185 [Desulfobacterales bacterium]|nr:hypothetical protein [Desulfobacterales bacterium]